MNDEAGRVRLSGRDEYVGSTEPTEPSGNVVGLRSHRRGTDRRSRWIDNPIYPLDEPIYLPDNEEVASRDPLQLVLHIDIDGIDPLNVVSGTVEHDMGLIDRHPIHFIGKVTTNTESGGLRQLAVEHFLFRWPGSDVALDRLELAVDGRSDDYVVADAVFTNTVRNANYGPYRLTRQSAFFREVEVDVDREDGAIDVEPYDTHAHPDRPDDLPRERITLEQAFAKAGIRITRSPNSGTVVDTSEAAENHRWNDRELHDCMSRHWDSFVNRPQWKLWIFLAELADDDTLGGIMFDGDIAEPGGVDRQGTAVFTLCPVFHTEAGEYVLANPPTAAAFQRELFFNLIHETGHAFNLAHSFQKTLGHFWTAPCWMPVASDSQALSWMNYPDQASHGLNASWFYQRFRFRFDDAENLFLRHGANWFVQMGNSAWFEHHGRVSRSGLDRRLELVARSRRSVIELGENVNIELRLKNVSNQNVMVHPWLHPRDGLVEIAITNPRGERWPLRPIVHHRRHVTKIALSPQQAIYDTVNVTMGHFGFHFKEPGAHRVEASYTNVNGGTAAAVTQIFVRTPSTDTDWQTVGALFNARVGRAMCFQGTRVMDDVNERIDWVLNRLGKKHPARLELATTRFLPLATPAKLIEPGDAKMRVLEPDPACVRRGLKPLVAAGGAAADALGHINYRRVIDTFVDCSLKDHKKAAARKAQQQMLSLFRDRGVVPHVVKEVEERVRQLK